MQPSAIFNEKQLHELVRRISKKELNGSPLTNEERDFLRIFERAVADVPGAFEEEVLRRIFPGGKRARRPVEPIPETEPAATVAKFERIAADEKPKSLYQAALNAANEKKEFVAWELEGGSVNLFRVVDSRIVQPCFLADYRFLVRREKNQEQVVDQIGLIFINLEDLKEMDLTVDVKRKTVILSKIESGAQGA